MMEPRSLKFCLLEKKLEDQILVFWTCCFLRFSQKPKNLSGRLSGRLLFFEEKKLSSRKLRDLRHQRSDEVFQKL